MRSASPWSTVLVCALLALASSGEPYDEEDDSVSTNFDHELQSLMQKAKGELGLARSIKERYPINVLQDDRVRSRSRRQAQALRSALVPEQHEQQPTSAYPWECVPGMLYNGSKFDFDELVRLQTAACIDEDADGTADAKPHTVWNTKHTEVEARSTLKWIVTTANIEKTAPARAAALAVKLFVLSPFEQCNSKVGACAGVNHLTNQGLTLNRESEFWDFKEQLERVGGQLGTWDEKNHEWQLANAKGEITAIRDLTGWLQANTEPRTAAEYPDEAEQKAEADEHVDEKSLD